MNTGDGVVIQYNQQFIFFRIVRDKNDNPYRAWEYYTEGGRWKQLPHELIVNIQNGEIKKYPAVLKQ